MDEGHSNEGIPPCTAEDGAGERCGRGDPPPTTGVRGVTPGNFEIANVKSCILVHFQPRMQSVS